MYEQTELAPQIRQWEADGRTQRIPNHHVVRGPWIDGHRVGQQTRVSSLAGKRQEQAIRSRIALRAEPYVAGRCVRCHAALEAAP